MIQRKEKEIPRIIIEESPANDLFLMLDGLMTGGTHLAQQAFEAIRDEGKEFAETSDSREFTSAIARGFFRDNERIADFLSRIESILKREPRLLAASDIVLKYLRELKPQKEAPAKRGAAKFRAAPPRKRESPQGNDLFFFLLGLFSLARNVVTSFEMQEIFRAVVNPEDNSPKDEPIEEDEQSERKSAAKIRRTPAKQSRSGLLR